MYGFVRLFTRPPIRFVTGYPDPLNASAPTSSAHHRASILLANPVHALTEHDCSYRPARRWQGTVGWLLRLVARAKIDGGTIHKALDLAFVQMLREKLQQLLLPGLADHRSIGHQGAL